MIQYILNHADQQYCRDLNRFGLLKNWYYSVNMAKKPFAAGNIVVSKLTQSDVWKGRTALGVECTLSDGSVEQYPCRQQSTLTYRPVLPKIKAIAYTRKRQTKQPCIDTEGEPQKAMNVVPQDMDG